MWPLLLVFLHFDLDLFSFATTAGSPQQREPINVGPYNQTHLANFPCERKHDFRQSVELCTLHMRTGFESAREGLTKNRTHDLRDERQVV